MAAIALGPLLYQLHIRAIHTHTHTVNRDDWILYAQNTFHVNARDSITCPRSCTVCSTGWKSCHFVPPTNTSAHLDTGNRCTTCLQTPFKIGCGEWWAIYQHCTDCTLVCNSIMSMCVCYLALSYGISSYVCWL